MNPLNWFRGTKSENIKDENIVEFEIIHTNWYWRQLRRKIKLCHDYLLRVHPYYGDVRAVHKYETIEKIIVVDKNNLILRYKDGSPDYFRCSGQDLQKIVDLIIGRCTKEIVLEYLPQKK